jgi:cystathionine beta-lyase/cystathionine gamma-synthase
MRFETRAIHGGQSPDSATGAVTVPIYATSTYAQAGPGDHKGYEYSRTANPTRTALEAALAAVEGADPQGGAVATASGMAATALLGYLLKPGDHVILPDDAYGGTYRFFAQVATEHGIEFTAADLTNTESLQKAVLPQTRMIWVESPTNPLLRLVDIGAAAAVAKEANALLVVDNTFATPFLQQPLALGADVVLHSSTKYLGGHSDVVGGALVTSDAALLERLRFLSNAAGPVPGPFDAYLVLRGLKTLAVRMERHCQNAEEVALFLSAHPQVAEVFYPGLDTHPQHELAKRQMWNYGGMVSFRPVGGVEAAHRIVTSTRLFTLAESLGAVESLIELPSEMTHMSVRGTTLEVPADLVRLSVGIEHIDDLLADLEQALG